MNVHRALISGVAVYAWAAVAWAGIPVPDVLLYGSVLFEGSVLTKDSSDVTIVARVDGVAQPVGAYRMGDVYAAGDMYALRIRMESGADGSAQSANAARVGQTVHIYAKKDTNPEQPLTDFTLSKSGLVQRLNLPPTPTVKPDFDQDWDVDEDDFSAFEACASGPGVARSSGCEGKDFDLDNDVDQRDFSLFQRCYSGAHVMANLSCDD